jgi:hypothetical protein
MGNTFTYDECKRIIKLIKKKIKENRGKKIVASVLSGTKSVVVNERT